MQENSTSESKLIKILFKMSSSLKRCVMLFICAGTSFAAVSENAQPPPPGSVADHGKPQPRNTSRTQQAVLQVGRRGEAAGGESTTTTVPRGMLRVSGVSCAKQSALNADFLVRGTTADSKPYYQSEDGTNFLYFDKSCDGKGESPASWIFGSSEPNITAASGLDGDGTCAFAGYTASGSLLPPKEAVWKLNCTDSLTNVSVSINDITFAGWHICPKGSFCRGVGCGTDTPGATIPRDRWDPEKVRAANRLGGLSVCLALPPNHPSLFFEIQPYISAYI